MECEISPQGSLAETSCYQNLTNGAGCVSLIMSQVIELGPGR
jgi:hypothetical protein